MAHLAPLWLFAHLPTRDGPTHLEGALLLLRYHQPGESVLRDWFELVLPVAPNWLDHLLLAGLSLVVPPVVAEKVLVASFVIGLPLAARRALAAVRPDAGFLAVLTFPFVYSWLLHMGFYNFCLSLPLFFLAIASWLRARASTRAAVVRLTGWATLLYFTHPVAPFAAAAILLMLGAWSGVVEAGEAQRLGLSLRQTRLQAWRRISRTALAFAPAAALLAAWGWGRRPPTFVRVPLHERLLDLARLDVLVTFMPAEVGLAAALSVVVTGLTLAGLAARARTRRLVESDGWLLGAFGFLLAYLLAPASLAGGGYVTPRLAVFPFFGLLLWLASRHWAATPRAVTAVVAAAISVSFLALHARSYREANDELAEYLSAKPWLAHGSTVLPLHYRQYGAREFPRVDVMAHAAAHLAVSRHTVDLVFYEGTGRGIFPIAFRREVNPYRHLGDNPESVPPCVDLESYMARTGRSVDTVLTWKRQADPGTTCAAFTLEQLRRGYERVHVSRPRNLLEVWHRRRG